MNTIENINPMLLDFKSQLIQLYGNELVELILFGSYARNQANENSDIDVLVILKNMTSPYSEIRKMSDIKYNLLEKYEMVLSTVPTSLERYNSMETSLYRTINKEGKVI